MIKCKYCGNNATRKDYRERNGQVNKELVCDICSQLTTEAVLDREYEYEELLKETFDMSLVDSVLDSGMSEFWDAVNQKVFEEISELENEFTSNSKFDLKVYEGDVDKWKDAIYNAVAKKAKEQF